jgi:hypothetical protein
MKELEDVQDELDRDGEPRLQDLLAASNDVKSYF